MRQKIVIYATDSFVNVEIQNGATRQVSGPNVGDVLRAMCAEDRDTLRTFVTGLVLMLDGQLLLTEGRS
jgi:hypothetical protein